MLGLLIVSMISRALNAVLSRFFRGFNAAFRWMTEGYVRIVSGLVRVSVLGLIFYAGMLYLTEQVFVATPTGFIPAQDKGYLLVKFASPRLLVAGANRTGHAAD